MRPLLLALTFSLSTPCLVRAETALLWGAEAEQEHCAASEGGVWADYGGGVECLRYFAGGRIDNAPLVIVVLRGDRDTWLNRRPEEIPQNSVSAQTAMAETLADDLAAPVIVLSRPGTFGASGDHRQRRQASEFLAIDAALDRIRSDHGIGRFVLVGHSGGATAAAALLTLGRDDIACAVLTSGAFGLLERAALLREAAGRPARPGLDTTGLPNPYDPLDHLDGIVADRDRRIILLGNRDDSVTPFHLQERFARGLQALGHRAELREVPAQAPGFHNLTDRAGLRATADCAGEATP